MKATKALNKKVGSKLKNSQIFDLKNFCRNDLEDKEREIQSTEYFIQFVIWTCLKGKVSTFKVPFLPSKVRLSMKVLYLSPQTIATMRIHSFLENDVQSRNDNIWKILI